MEYFALPVRWDQRTLYLLYYCNDQDGVVLSGDGRMLWTSTEEELRKAAKQRKVKLQEVMPELDLTELNTWVRSRHTRLPEAAGLYRCWNLLGDIASSLDKGDAYLGYDEDYASIHEELFWGSNLPGFSQSQERYQVDLSQGEIKNLKAILRSGLEIFQQGLGS